jgi:hypothetical protein
MLCTVLGLVLREVSALNEQWGAGRGGEPTVGGTYDVVGTCVSHLHVTSDPQNNMEKYCSLTQLRYRALGKTLGW